MGENKGDPLYLVIPPGYDGWTEGFPFVISSAVKFIFDGWLACNVILFLLILHKIPIIVLGTF